MDHFQAIYAARTAEYHQMIAAEDPDPKYVEWLTGLRRAPLLIFAFACPSASPADSPSPRNSSNTVAVVSVLSCFIIFLLESSEHFDLAGRL